jgi:hypothetical protein
MFAIEDYSDDMMGILSMILVVQISRGNTLDSDFSD